MASQLLPGILHWTEENAFKKKWKKSDSLSATQIKEEGWFNSWFRYIVVSECSVRGSSFAQAEPFLIKQKQLLHRSHQVRIISKPT